MFRAINLPIFRSTRLCVTPTMLPAGHRPATSWVHYNTSCNTQSHTLEVEQINCPKHVELTGIINKLLLLHLVGCLYYFYQWSTVKQISDNEIYLLIKYIKSVLWRVAKRLSYIEYARCLKVNIVTTPIRVQHQGPCPNLLGMMAEAINCWHVFCRSPPSISATV